MFLDAAIWGAAVVVCVMWPMALALKFDVCDPERHPFVVRVCIAHQYMSMPLMGFVAAKASDYYRGQTLSVLPGMLAISIIFAVYVCVMVYIVRRRWLKKPVRNTVLQILLCWIAIWPVAILPALALLVAVGYYASMEIWWDFYGTATMVASLFILSIAVPFVRLMPLRWD